MKSILGHLGVLFLFGLVFIADYMTGSEVGFGGYYILVIGVAIFYLGNMQGYVLALAVVLCRIYIFIYAPPLPKNNLFSVVIDAGSVSFITFGFSFLLIKIKSQVAKLRKMAKTDSLTGAQTSSVFQEQVDFELKRINRYKHPLSVIFLDIDDFKSINDKYGHIVGDRLLSKLALSILDTLRKNDSIGRLGGDEFAIMLVETNSEQVKEATRRIQNAIDSTSKALKIPLSCSIGAVTILGGRNIDPEELLCKADEAMYAIKNTSKNAVHYVVLN